MNGIWLPICALILAIYIVVLFFARGSVKNSETMIYKKLIIINLMHSLLAVCIYLFEMKVGNLYFKGILESLYLILVFLMLLLLLKYAIEINKIDNKIKKKMNMVLNIITTVSIIPILALPINNIITSEVLYFNGPAYYVAMAEVALYIILIMIFNILFCIRNKNEKTKLLPFISLATFFIIDIIIHNYYPQVNIETFIFTFSYLIMYHTIENPDVKLMHQLTLAKNQADKVKSDKSNFISDFSHEIKTSLNAIVGFSECVKQEKDINSCYKDADDIITASQNLLEIVNGVLDNSNIDSKKIKKVVTNYRPREIFEKSTKSILKKIAEKKLEFNVNISKDIPEVLQGEAVNLEKIITNILNNAVKYTEHGYINFDVKCTNTNDISKLIISVQDTGIGIKSEQIDKIFNKSEHLDEHKNTTIDEKGLELAFVKKYVDMMGGNIAVQSRYGEGTRFTVYLKQKIVNDQTELNRLNNKSIKVKPIDLQNKKVLIVDDNKLNIKVCTKLLDSYNLDISAVESGLECIELLKSGATFNLILMDDLMPKMTGTETLINLKKEFANFNIPIVVLTANNVIEKRAEYLNAGFIDCLGKPIEKTQLHSILVKYLNINNNVQRKKEPEKKNIELETTLMDLTGKKILIVDDNNLNLKVAENFMKSYNPIIETVNSGKECLMRTKTENYDLILLDDMMPQLSGIETMKLIKNNRSFDTPIIVLTANTIDGAKDNYLEAGFDDYLAKPIDKQKLNDILKKYIVDRYSKNNDIEEKNYHTVDFLQENGIVVKDGLEYFKNMDNYDQAVNEFINNISNIVVKMSQYKTSHNLSEYALIINDLRKKCRNLGINKLVDMVFNHELKSRDGNVKFIDEHFDELLKEISNTVEILKKYMK